ncbi:MAG: methylenetetrahydrofolate reductase [Pseudomonadota bacterium]|nr:methylenetetrahydrofolate reductase [Pseudomonadota bacterium]
MSDINSLAVDSKLVRRLIAGEFAVTAEITPPEAAGPEPLLEKAMMLKDYVDAVNVTDGASARVHMSSVTSGAILAANDIEPVVQFTCRDRNRIAIMSDLLGAGAQGIHNLLMLRGDNPTQGDQPDAKAVFDFESADLIRIARQMTDKGTLPSIGAKVKGDDVEIGTRPIKVPPQFFVGAADTPTAEPNEKWIDGLGNKIKNGAQFIQTQLCYDMEIVRKYAELLVEKGFSEQLFVLIGNGPLLSARSAIWMRENLYGVAMPDSVIQRLKDADDSKEEGMKLCVEQMREMANIKAISGVHLMAPINTTSIPGVIEGAAISNRS